MQYVSRQELVETIKTVKTSSAVSILAETEVDANKTGNPFHGATKVNTMAGLIGFDYSNSVNNELGREDKPMDFRAQSHKWAVPTDSRNLVTNKDATKLYLRMKVQSSGTPRYFLDGEEISQEAIAPFLKEHKTPHTQDNLDKEIVVRMIKVENILSMKILKEEYRVSESLTEQVRERIGIAETVTT